MKVISMHPFADRIKLEIIKPEQVTAGGLVMPDTAENANCKFGKVLEVGFGKVLSDGTVAPMRVAKGDYVLYSHFAGQKYQLSFGGDEHLFINEEDVVALVSVERGKDV